MATHRRRRNAGGSVDTGSARELELFVENDAQLHRSQEVPIQKNLITKMARGVYNHNGAVKLYGYLMENGAKKYNREHGGGGSVWHEMFNTATRKAAAERFASSFETEAKLGNYDYLLPKKYQKSKSNPGRGTTVPAHVRINPRNGRIQVFVTPKVAEKLRGGKGLRVARNPKEYTLYPGGVTFPTADDARSALRYEREKYPSAYVVSPSGKRLKVASTRKGIKVAGNPTMGPVRVKHFPDKSTAYQYAKGLMSVKTPPGWPKLKTPVIKKYKGGYSVRYRTWNDD